MPCLLLTTSLPSFLTFFPLPPLPTLAGHPDTSQRPERPPLALARHPPWPLLSLYLLPRLSVLPGHIAEHGTHNQLLAALAHNLSLHPLFPSSLNPSFPSYQATLLSTAPTTSCPQVLLTISPCSSISHFPPPPFPSYQATLLSVAPTTSCCQQAAPTQS